MNDITRVDFHCHSVLSDATLTPAKLADRLAAAGVCFASLTDHDTIEGMESFHRRLAKRGIGFIPGVEITTIFRGQETHLLAYGFDPSNPELQETLNSLQRARSPSVQSLADSIRHRGAAHRPAASASATSAAPAGQIEMAAAIVLVHRAGGRAFLAHPLAIEPDPDALSAILSDLKTEGLDGIEAIYANYTSAQCEQLVGLADRLGLLISAGSDWHHAGQEHPGIDMPTELWKRFRAAVCFGTVPVRSPPVYHPSHVPRWRSFGFRIILPAMITTGLFVAVLFAVLLPAFERSLLDRKREMIRELTRSACSILAEYEREERAGLLTREQAQQMARTRIEALRYGRESKDYFWIQDLHPRMIMHPYRRDLNGQDVTEFRDPRGVQIFVAFADLFRRQQEGYIAYVWQWQDDPRRLVPKESYIQGFAPWGWIIGTGMYVDDVREEIVRIERDLVRVSLIITVVVVALLLTIVLQSLRIERERSEAEDSLRDSTERYRALVEATTEGTLLVLNGRCRYANPTFNRMLGYTNPEIDLLDFFDVLPAEAGNESAHAAVRRLLRGEEPAGGFEGTLRRRDGSSIECALALSRISYAGMGGFILLAKDIVPSLEIGSEPVGDRLPQLASMADAVPVGIFRARAVRRGPIITANRAAMELFRSHRGDGGNTPPFLADLFSRAVEFDDVYNQLLREGVATQRVHFAAEGSSMRIVALNAVLERDERGQPRFIDGTLEDVTAAARREIERETLVKKLQTSLLFLHEPVRHLVRVAVTCRLNTPVAQAASLMNQHGAGAVLVQSETDDIVGILTDHDLRERVLAAGADPAEPVYRVMSSPLISVRGDTPIYEALLRMQDQGIQHLAVTGESGLVIGTVRPQDLLLFQSYGSIVLTREILRAATVEEVVRCCRRAPGFATALLDCGAHAHVITRMLVSACDAATERFITMAIHVLGPPPAPFAFLALGSQGRQEQTLATDQDNAILYALPADGADADAVARYFLALGTRVCEWLNEAGYLYCRGNSMASNPRWCQSLPVWKQYFDDWIGNSEPKELMEFSIFFDFRAVYGNAQLAEELRRHVYATLRGAPAFFPRFAQNALLFKPPHRLFGKIRIVDTGGEPGSLNLKDALVPIVNFARLYTLQHECDVAHTLDRLNVLVEKALLPDAVREEIGVAYEFLMKLRLRHQAVALQAGHTPDNAIHERTLTQIEETLLHQSFERVVAMQTMISRDFLGGPSGLHGS